MICPKTINQIAHDAKSLSSHRSTTPKGESFYEPAHQRIYEAIQSLGAAQKPIDMLTVVEQLRLNNTLDEVGGPVVISELTSRVASGAHVEFHARIVAQKYLARELITFASSIEGKAFDESNDVDDLLQEAEGTSSTS